MADPRTRERVVELCRQMREHTVENGCTPGEAAKFAAKVAEWMERYAIEEAELRQEQGADPEDIEVCENRFRTGKRVFNLGITQVFSGLAQGMCCKVIMTHLWNPDLEIMEAVYGIVGEQSDADYVCQVASVVIPALQVMGRMEGAEHGYEKAGLVRWLNQYLMGAGEEIRKRLEADRRQRSEVKRLETEARQAAAPTSTALAVITGETLAAAKREAADAAFKELYPKTRTTYSRSGYDGTARERGREAGRRVGLHRGIEG